MCLHLKQNKQKLENKIISLPQPNKQVYLLNGLILWDILNFVLEDSWQLAIPIMEKAVRFRVIHIPIL